MRIFYGADPADYDPEDEIELQVVRTLRYDRAAVYDSSGQETLYADWDIEVLALMNPAATSYAGDIGVGPIQQQGISPIRTDRNIRHRMLEQRRLLRIVSDEDGPTVAERTLLQSPAPVLPGNTPYTCDARGGPYPQAFNILAVHGQPVTIVVYFRIKTCVQECAQYGNNVILSHRWRQRGDVDQDHFAVRVTDGEVVFNMAELVQQGKLPDDFRSRFFHPVPTNFKRDHVSVAVSEDGTKAFYTTVDVEKSHLMQNSPATRIEAYHTEFVTQPGAYHIGKAVIGGIGGVLGGAAGAKQNNVGGRLGNFLGGPLGMVFGAVSGGYDALEAVTPSAYSHVFVRCWGNRNSVRQNLAQYAMSIAFGRLMDWRWLLLPTWDLSLTRDLFGKFVEVNYILKHPLGTFLIDKAFKTLSGFDLGQFNLQKQIKLADMGYTIIPHAFMVDNETITQNGQLKDGLPKPNVFGDFKPINLPDDVVFVTTGDGSLPNLPMDQNSRGTWVGRLVAQALEKACSVPACPTNPSIPQSPLTPEVSPPIYERRKCPDE